MRRYGSNPTLSAKRYRAVLEHFRAFSIPYTQVGTITPADIDAFRDERLARKNSRGKPISPRNVNYEVATIRSFYYCLQKFRDSTLANPAARLKPFAVTKTVVDTYDEVELEKFFQACTKEQQAVFNTFYYTGLREQEMAHLRLDLSPKRRQAIKTQNPWKGEWSQGIVSPADHAGV